MSIFDPLTDREIAIARLTNEYGVLVAACNMAGTIAMWKAAQPEFQRIYNEGQKWDMHFDANPTLCWKGLDTGKRSFNEL